MINKIVNMFQITLDQSHCFSVSFCSKHALGTYTVLTAKEVMYEHRLHLQGVQKLVRGKEVQTSIMQCSHA